MAEETVQTEKIDSGKYQLADQNPPQISLHTDHGNGKKYEQEPDQKTDHVGDKDPPRHSQPLQNARERGIQIQKRTDESQRHDEMPGQFTVEQFGSHPIPQKKKTAQTKKAHETAVFYGTQSVVPYGFPVTFCMIFGDGRRRTATEPVRALGKKIMGMAIPVSTPYTLKAVVVS